MIKRKRGSFNCAAEMAAEPREKQSEWTESYQDSEIQPRRTESSISCGI